MTTPPPPESYTPYWQFRELPESDQALLREHLTPRCLEGGEILWREGQTSDICMAFLVRGRLKALKRDPFHHSQIVLAVLDPGAVIGMPFDNPRDAAWATLQATEDSEILVMCDSVFEHLLREHPDLAITLLRRIHRDLSHRLRYAAERIVHFF